MEQPEGEAGEHAATAGLRQLVRLREPLPLPPPDTDAGQSEARLASCYTIIIRPGKTGRA